MSNGAGTRKPGRPRAIPQNLILLVISLYQSGLGYRAIARELCKQDISADWSTVRRVIKANLGKANHQYDS